VALLLQLLLLLPPLALQQHQACCDAAYHLCWSWPNRQNAARARPLRVACAQCASSNTRQAVKQQKQHKQ
jgi:hypothetical protein